MSSNKNLYVSKYGSFEKLNKLNYRAWESKVTIVLQSLKAYKIVTREEQAPPNGNTAAARAATADFEARYAQAMTIIGFSVAEELDSRLIGIKDPATMWEILKRDLDGTTSQAGRTRLAKEFHTMRPKASEPISDYCARLLQHRMQLDGTMQQITDQILINHIFITIPDTYNTNIDTLQHIPEEQATVDYVVERLKDFEQLELKNDIGDPNTAGTSGSALYAKGKGGKRGKGGKNGKNW